MSRRGAARGRGLTLLLAALVAGLAYANWQVVRLELDISPAAAGVDPVEPFAPPALEPPAEPPPLAQFEATVQRPLFSATRRPPEADAEEDGAEAAEAAGAETEPPPPELRLVGVAIGGAARQALLRTPDEGEEWVREGDSVSGWQLESVGSDGVVLRAGDESRELSLYPAREAASGGE